MASSIKNSLAFLLFFFFFSGGINGASFGLREEHDKLAKWRMTHLHFYFHEIVAGGNQTSFVVASLQQLNSSGFGDVRAFDNALRKGPEPGSELVGRAQGLSVGTSAAGPPSVMAGMNFVLTAGEFSGSTISTFGTIQAKFPVDQTIVGGSGRFRMARGYATRKLVQATASLYIVEFDVYVMH